MVLAVTGLNHITLAVSDVPRSLAFYRDVLGFRPRAVWDMGAYLEIGTLWLCLSKDKDVRLAPHPDYTHIASACRIPTTLIYENASWPMRQFGKTIRVKVLRPTFLIQMDTK